jgi:5-methylcytosine-specific restriction endonuclease McrA
MSRKSPEKKRRQKINRKRRILKAYGCACIYCKKPLTLETMTIEHVVPRAKGGKNTIDNLRPACGFCNSVHRNPNDVDHISRNSLDIAVLRIKMYFRKIYRLATKSMLSIVRPNSK